MKSEVEVIGLQEVTVRFEKGKVENLAEKIARELSWSFAFSPSLDSRKDRSLIMGNAVLSKFPIAQVAVYPLNPAWLSYDGTSVTEPRALLVCRIKCKREEFYFLTTHLQFSPNFTSTEIRITQVENLLSIIRSLSGSIVVAGDFNALPESKE